jgi:hypothetical protein
LGIQILIKKINPILNNTLCQGFHVLTGAASFADLIVTGSSAKDEKSCGCVFTADIL